MATPIHTRSEPTFKDYWKAYAAPATTSIIVGLLYSAFYDLIPFRMTRDIIIMLAVVNATIFLLGGFSYVVALDRDGDNSADWTVFESGVVAILLTAGLGTMLGLAYFLHPGQGTFEAPFRPIAGDHYLVASSSVAWLMFAPSLMPFLEGHCIETNNSKIRSKQNTYLSGRIKSRDNT